MMARQEQRVEEVALTRKERDALDTIAWGMKHFGSLLTGRACQRAVVLRLVAKGLAESKGLVTVCDDDGWIKQPEREREGFTLTQQGIALHAELEKARTPPQRATREE